MLVLACAKLGPPRSKVTPNDIKRAVQDAHAACLESKATPQCRIMWDRVSDLTHAFARQKDLEAEQKREEEWIEKDDELENRLYDV